MGRQADFSGVFRRLYEAYGPQSWWPADSPFEVMVGEVLTQNTAWINVERAIANLKEADSLNAVSIAALPPAELADLIRPSGYFNVKAARLQSLCRWYLEQGGYDALDALSTGELRRRLLAVKGVGPETADDIVLYAFHRPVFVIDAYTRRLFGRLGLVEPEADYEALRGRFEEGLAHEPEPVRLFNEYHALIVQHAKESCRKRPACDACVLAMHCPSEADTPAERDESRSATGVA